MLLVLISFFAACPLVGLSLAKLDRAYGEQVTLRLRERAMAVARPLRRRS
ncbi:MAG: hypothetical protein JWO33_2678 [Caulobacteraceae bacterium]|nr:hypothetical protein [Caulobacteraceae bacterium]